MDVIRELHLVSWLLLLAGAVLFVHYAMKVMSKENRKTLMIVLIVLGLLGVMFTAGTKQGYHLRGKYGEGKYMSPMKGAPQYKMPMMERGKYKDSYWKK